MVTIRFKAINSKSAKHFANYRSRALLWNEKPLMNFTNDNNHPCPVF